MVLIFAYVVTPIQINEKLYIAFKQTGLVYHVMGNSGA